MEKFWMVWNPRGAQPRMQHDSYDSANNEARRLAEKDAPQEFFVLEAISVSRKISIETTMLQESRPF